MKIDAKSFVLAKVIGGSDSGGGVSVDSLTVKSNPDTTTYFIGETLDLTGLQVEAVVGSLEGDVTKDCTITPADGSEITLNTTKISIKYGNQTAEIPLTLRIPTQISVTTQPTKTQYMVGDVVDLTGVEVRTTYTDVRGTTVITDKCTFTPASGQILDSSSITAISVEFAGLTTSIPISVYDVESIAVTTAPTKTTYKTGDTLNLSGLVVTGYANSGALTKNVTSGCSFSPANGSTLTGDDGTYSVTVTYGSLTTSFNYTIVNAPAWDNRGMAYNSWDTIAWYIRNKQTSGKMAVGNTKQITTSDGKTITMQLVSINDGSGSAGQYYPEGTADFISVELIDSLKFSDSNSTSGWGQSSCRTYLNSTRYNTLPSDVKQNIINKTHRYTVGGGNSFTELSDKLWLPTTWEMCGRNTGSGVDTYENANENKHYTIFVDDNARKKKPISSSKYQGWWSSTNHKTNYNYYVDIAMDNGVMSYTSQDMSGFYATLCFRIG